MTDASTLVDLINRAFLAPDRGVVGTVDSLLAISRDHAFRLNWVEGRCCLFFGGNGSEAPFEFPLQKSILRAVLARIAVLCNEKNPNSVSPYRGEGELLVKGEPVEIVRVSFVNTPEQQSLEILTLPVGASVQKGGPVSSTTR